ncbi:hypothetical protein RRG08_046503 [Elysia crispata]|uniref:Uncharacterized protein n=1 Tax=Elysia crispata TaxID=231223 RepID=A0AAE0YIE5_9GAST|nr:hypothetical protein RRG08_046503 [Elysia crispata]
MSANPRFAGNSVWLKLQAVSSVTNLKHSTPPGCGVSNKPKTLYQAVKLVTKPKTLYKAAVESVTNLKNSTPPGCGVSNKPKTLYQAVKLVTKPKTLYKAGCCYNLVSRIQGCGKGRKEEERDKHNSHGVVEKLGQSQDHVRT